MWLSPVEHLVRDQGVGGSNPLTPTKYAIEMYFTYILHSKSLNRYYAGSTKNLVNRLEEHNNGEGKYTKSGKPWNLVKHFEFNSRSEAIVLENKIKKRGIKRFLEDSNY